ncbi:MAG TPA: hypothetical protein VLV81_10030 [Acidimicrobiia bacterium]|nr:hypothetical protein [Acidimicrobiia bacterium]
MTRRARVAGLLAAAIVLAACGGGSGSSSAAHHVGSSTTATTGGGGYVNIGIICTSPRDAALAAVNAWIAGDRAAAHRCVAPAAVESLFARPAGTEGWILQRCAGTVCSFTHPFATLRLTTGGSDAAGWVVTGVAFGR